MVPFLKGVHRATPSTKPARMATIIQAAKTEWPVVRRILPTTTHQYTNKEALSFDDKAFLSVNSNFIQPFPSLFRRFQLYSESTPELKIRSHHSTVTDFAKLRGWSTSVPFISAT